ncbi:MAG: hypothetical protein WCY41_00430 [Candidatus Micrarchaeia archaeon]
MRNVKTMTNLAKVEAIVKGMEKNGGRDRIFSAEKGLALLRQVPLGNGSREKAIEAADGLARELRKDYGCPEKRIRAAVTVTKITSFAREITPFGGCKAGQMMVETLCLA